MKTLLAAIVDGIVVISSVFKARSGIRPIISAANRILTHVTT